MTSERLKRLSFIKKHSPKKFNKSLMSGKLVPSASEMNKLFGKKSKIICYRKEKDKKFHLDVDGSKRYGLQFSTKKAMRNSIKTKYKIREC